MTRKRVNVNAPLEWLENASVQEIGEALLAVDEAKAAQVVLYLVSRAQSEAENTVREIENKIKQNPIGSILKGLSAISKN